MITQKYSVKRKINWRIMADDLKEKGLCIDCRTSKVTLLTFNGHNRKSSRCAKCLKVINDRYHRNKCLES